MPETLSERFMREAEQALREVAKQHGLLAVWRLSMHTGCLIRGAAVVGRDETLVDTIVVGLPDPKKPTIPSSMLFMSVTAERGQYDVTFLDDAAAEPAMFSESGPINRADIKRVRELSRNLFSI